MNTLHIKGNLRILVGFALLIIAAQSQAQTLVRVMDKTGKGIPDVHIRVANTNLGTTTDFDGNFNPELVGKQLVILSCVGYSAREVLLTDTTTRIAMEESTLLLNNQVVVTANRYESLEVDRTGSVSALDSRRLSVSPGRTMPEKLLGTTGVWVQKTNHGGGSPIMRGLVGNQILLMMDGIRVNNSTYRYGPNQYLTTFDPAMIGQVEVLRGNGSVAYGSDALGGTIQLLSKTPAFTPQRTLGSSVSGTWMSAGMEKSTRVQLQLADQNVALMGGYSYKDYGNLLAGDGIGVQRPTGYFEQAADVKAVVRTSSQGVLTAMFQRQSMRQVPRYDQVSQGGYDYYNFDPQNRELAYLRWETLPGISFIESIRLTGSYGHTREGLRSQKTGSTDVTIADDQVHTWGGIAEMRNRFAPQWKAITGVEYYYDRVFSKLETRTINGDQIPKRGAYANGSTLGNMAIYTLHTYEQGAWILEGGARFNRVVATVTEASFGNTQITPQAWVSHGSIQWKIGDHHRLGAGFNTSFRAPNLDDMSKLGPVEVTVYEVPSYNLAPERGVTRELSWKSRYRKFSSSLAAYHTNLRDLIDRIPTTWNGEDTLENRRVYTKANVGKAEVYGLEADGAFESGPWTVQANVSYTHGANLTKKEPMRRIPPVFGTFTLGYRKNNWFVQSEWSWAGNQFRLAKGDRSDARIAVRLVDGRMPGWNVVNLHAGADFKKVTVRISALNLANAPYRIYASGVDGVGRSLRIALQYSISH